jgi:hypothetical protein
VAAERFDVEKQLRIDVYPSKQPGSLTVAPDSGFVDCDPRRLRRHRNARRSGWLYESFTLVNGGGSRTLSDALWTY